MEREKEGRERHVLRDGERERGEGETCIKRWRERKRGGRDMY